jgi:hypothetical protein
MKIICKIPDAVCPQGLNICCGICENKCDDCCPTVIRGEDHILCSNAEPVTDAMMAFQTSVPEAINIITEINLQKKKLDEQEKLMRQKLLEAMETYGIKKFENEHIAFTYVAPTTKITIDSTKLKKKYPDIAEECSKVSNVSASVRISVK